MLDFGKIAWVLLKKNGKCGMILNTFVTLTSFLGSEGIFWNPGRVLCSQEKEEMLFTR